MATLAAMTPMIEKRAREVIHDVISRPPIPVMQITACAGAWDYNPVAFKLRPLPCAYCETTENESTNCRNCGAPVRL